MSWAADVVNKVYDTLEAAKLTGQPLAYMKETYFGGAPGDTNMLAAPCMSVLLDPEDSLNEAWAASQSQREGTLKIKIGIMAEEPGKDSLGKPRPYGVSSDTARRGILTMMDDVMNAIDLARSFIMGANTRLLDLNMTGSVAGRQGDTRNKWGAEITLTIRARYQAGGR
jgi:hypothetical protein